MRLSGGRGGYLWAWNSAERGSLVPQGKEAGRGVIQVIERGAREGTCGSSRNSGKPVVLCWGGGVFEQYSLVDFKELRIARYYPLQLILGVVKLAAANCMSMTESRSYQLDQGLISAVGAIDTLLRE